jgi:predicted TIM-barrel fold metal-dependent hydrolase
VIQLKIIDIHTHIWPEKLASRAVSNVGDYYNYEMHGKGTLSDLKQSTSEAGVEYFVIHSSALKANQVEDVNTNAALNISDKIAGFGTLHPEYTDFEKEIDRIIALGLKGIKLHPDFQFFNIDDKRMYPAYEIIASKRLPVLFHMCDINYDYSSAKRLSKLMNDFPKLICIGAHMGGHMKWDEAEEFLIGKNLYLDTSSTSRKLSPEEIKRLIRLHGADKVLFGTDYPIERHKEALEKFFRLGLTDDENEKILFSNAWNLVYSG